MMEAIVNLIIIPVHLLRNDLSELVIDYGEDEDGNTPLHLASHGNNL